MQRLDVQLDKLKHYQTRELSQKENRVWRKVSGGAAVVLTPSEVEMVVYSGLGSVAHFNHRNEQDILS